MAFMRAEKYTWPVSILQSHKPSLDPRAAIAVPLLALPQPGLGRLPRPVVLLDLRQHFIERIDQHPDFAARRRSARTE